MDRNQAESDEYKEKYVALRKESVDRNMRTRRFILFLPLSLSARRAWIEIQILSIFFINCPVALRKESVDRNAVRGIVATRPTSRSPQGERG